MKNRGKDNYETRCTHAIGGTSQEQVGPGSNTPLEKNVFFDKSFYKNRMDFHISINI